MSGGAGQGLDNYFLYGSSDYVGFQKLFAITIASSFFDLIYWGRRRLVGAELGKEGIIVNGC